MLTFQTSRHNAISHHAAVAGGITLDCACSKYREVIRDRYAGFCFRHRTDITGQTVFLCHIDVRTHGILLKQYTDIDRRNLTSQTDQIRESAQQMGQLIFVQNNDLLG